jgi:hypothetical protein
MPQALLAAFSLAKHLFFLYDTQASKGVFGYGTNPPAKIIHI